MHIVCEYKNNLLTSLFCHTFDNRDKHKLQRKKCRSYFLNITKKSQTVGREPSCSPMYKAGYSNHHIPYPMVASN